MADTFKLLLLRQFTPRSITSCTADAQKLAPEGVSIESLI
jgi:hypothetical protein